jgi:hypothetical protein
VASGKSGVGVRVIVGVVEIVGVRVVVGVELGSGVTVTVGVSVLVGAGVKDAGEVLVSNGDVGDRGGMLVGIIAGCRRSPHAMSRNAPKMIGAMMARSYTLSRFEQSKRVIR